MTWSSVTRSRCRRPGGDHTAASLARVRDQRPAPNIVVGETRADSQGAFRFDDLGIERYEVVAVHQEFGIGVRGVTPDGRDLDITLNPPSPPAGAETGLRPADIQTRDPELTGCRAA